MMIRFAVALIISMLLSVWSGASQAESTWQVKKNLITSDVCSAQDSVINSDNSEPEFDLCAAPNLNEIGSNRWQSSQFSYVPYASNSFRKFHLIRGPPSIIPN
jgi:hypothetical protein